MAAAGLAGAPDVVVTATLSKALGGAGRRGRRARPRSSGTWSTPAAPSSTTPRCRLRSPPGARAALALARTGDDLRAELADRAGAPVRRLGAAGLTVSAPDGGVVSVTAPGPEAAVAWAADCRDRGVAVGCFRPPSTPDGRSRLRLTLNAGVPRRADFDTTPWSAIVEVRPAAASLGLP